MSRTAWLIIAATLAVQISIAQPILVGNTAANFLQNGSGGRMIAMDTGGNAQIVWHRYYDWTWNVRQVHYNIMQGGLGLFGDNGVLVDGGLRSGFPRIASTPNGYGFPAYHLLPSTAGELGTAVACDFVPLGGAFTNCSGDGDSVFAHLQHPRIAVDSQGDVHLMCCDYSDSEEGIHRFAYLRGTPEFNNIVLMGISWNVFSFPDDFGPSISVSTGCDISCSGNRVARAWTAATADNWNNPTLFGNDVYLQFSNDRGLTWDAPRNLTMFEIPDQTCYDAGIDPICCNRDTLRATPDVNIMFDADGVLHVVFTTVVYYNWDCSMGDAGYNRFRAQIWHWDEESDDFSTVASSWINGPLPEAGSLGGADAYITGPVISQDSSSGHLFCTFTEHDTAHYSEAEGLYNAEILISVSTDNGDSWSRATDVTSTFPHIQPAPLGENMIEQDVSVNQWAVDNLLHLVYLLDVNGYSGPGPGDPMPLNLIYYLTVPVGMIQPIHLVEEQNLHVGTIQECLDDLSIHDFALPQAFTLSAFPNPFNSSVSLEYTLPGTSDVMLRIFDINGRETATLVQAKQTAGTHTYSWAATDAATGVYFARLETATETHTTKLLLIK